MSKIGLLSGLTILLSLLLVGQGVYAQMKSLDIGDAAEKPGSTEILPDGTVTIVGAGHDIWDDADGFRYVYVEGIRGNFVVDVQIPFFQRIQEWAKAGIMARQSVDPKSKNALSTAAAGKGPGELGVQITWRAETGGETKELDYWELGGPKGFNDGEWVRLKRAGNDFSASWSKDGVTWAKDYATATVKMDDPVLVGLAVTSCEKTMLCKATLKNLTVNGVPIMKLITAVSPSGKLPKMWGEIKSSY